jgi:hypothetical protein
MAISSRGCFDYRATLHADGLGAWIGTAADDRHVSLVGPRPSVVLRRARLTLTRHRNVDAGEALAAAAHVDVGHAPEAVLRNGDLLACRRDAATEITLSLIRDGRLRLHLGASAIMGDTRLAIEHDPRVEDAVLAREIRYISKPESAIYWLDPSRPDDLEARLREIGAPAPGVKLRAIVARTDDPALRLDLNRRTMQPGRYRDGAAVFLTASERFATLDAWLEHGRSLPTERPADLWLRVSIDGVEQRIPQGRTTTIGDWLVHVHRVYEPGVPARASMVGVVHTDTGVSASVLEASTGDVARGATIERSPTGDSTRR